MFVSFPRLLRPQRGTRAGVKSTRSEVRLASASPLAVVHRQQCWVSQLICDCSQVFAAQSARFRKSAQRLLFDRSSSEKQNIRKPEWRKYKEEIMATKRSEKGLLTPDNCVVAIIDLQPQMMFGVGNFDRQTIINNNVGLLKATR